MGNAWIALRIPGGSAYCPFILETKLDTYMGPSVRCIAGNRTVWEFSENHKTLSNNVQD